jgi:glycosyltransferase involved in cell wall biosynthesis
MPGRARRNPIRLLVLTNMYPSAKRPLYGAFVRDQVESLRAAGVEAEVLFIDGRTSRAEYLRAVPRIRHAVRGGFDLVHAHYGLTGFLALCQRRLPVVITYHGDDLLGTPGPRGGATLTSRTVRVMSRWAAPRARAVVVVSRELLRALPEGPARHRAHVLPMGVDLARFRAAPRDEACRALGLDPQPSRVLFAADPKLWVKRHALADAAVQHLRQDRADVLLHVANGMPHERMPLVMSACDVLVLTSLHEGSPMVVKEALACGLPIVSVDVGDVAELTRGVAGCRIVPAEAASIAAALGDVLDQHVRGDGRGTVAALSLAHVAEELVAIYRSVLQS